MKPEEFGKWLESWVKERGAVPQVEQPKLANTVYDGTYNPYEDIEWLTRSWGLIR